MRRTVRTRPRRVVGVLAASGVMVLTCLIGCSASSPPGPDTSADASGIHKIKHVIVIMQENRSFDDYFGTFPGADGIPMQNGQPTVCVPDSQTGSFDAYDKFIEDDFLGGQRLDPRTDGRPDPRPDVREDVPILGGLTSDFDFTQSPRPPVVLPVHPVTTLTGTPTGPQAAAAQAASGPDDD